MAFLVTSEYQTENLFRQPAIKQTQLRSVGDMLQIIVNDSDVSHALVDGL